MVIYLRICVSIVFIIVILNIPAQQKWDTDYNYEQLYWIILGTTLAFACIALKTLKWHMLILSVEPKVKYKESIKSYLAGIPLSLLTPGRLGVISRIVFLPYKTLQGKIGVGSVFIDAFIDLLALFWWLPVGLYFFDPPLIILFLSTFIIALLSFVKYWIRYLTRMPFFFLLKYIYEKYQDVIQSLINYPMFTPILLAVSSFGIEWLQYWAFFNALAPVGIKVSLLQSISVMLLVTFTNVFQISFAGIGVREGLSAFLLANHLPPTSAALATFFVFFIDNAIPGLIGLFFKPVYHYNTDARTNSLKTIEA